MVEMTMEEYNEYLEDNGYGSQPKKPSMFKKIIKGLGHEIGDAHQFMLRQRDKASARNAQINKLNGRGKKKRPEPDGNILHAHRTCKIGW